MYCYHDNKKKTQALFCFFGLRKGVGLAIRNQGIGVGAGSAAQLVEGNLLKSGHFGPDTIVIATSPLLPRDHVQTFSRSELVRKQF